MAVVDERGRLFGRFNLVDAFLLLFLVALVPLGYAAYLLFRTPPPRLLAVEPNAIQHSTQMRITVRGEYLRPYMRVSVGDAQGRDFLFYNASTAEVNLPEIPPGVYDVVLYDYAQERSRLPKALTIQPPPLPGTKVDVVGAIRNVASSFAQAVTVGLEFPQFGTVQHVGRPRPSVTRANVGDGVVEIPVENAIDLPLVIRAGCYLQGAGSRTECVGGGVALVPDAYVMLQTAAGLAPFQIDQVRAPEDPQIVDTRVRFIGDPEALELVKPGDLDEGTMRNELVAGAKVVGVGGVRRLSSSVSVLSDSQVVIGDALAIREAMLQVPAQRGVSGWRYAGKDLRVGSPLRFKSPLYEISGSVVSIGAARAAAAPTARESSQ